MTPQKLAEIRSGLTITGGTFDEEHQEQIMAALFVRPDATVLEVGGNIGRNSLVIASILDDDRRLVVLECNTDYIPTLCANRDQNHKNFVVVAAALSARPLVQKGWDTRPAGVSEDGWLPVNTVTYTDLRAEYHLDFDTLVFDCEGAAYYILQDFPQLLDGVHTVIIESDFWDASHKIAVDNALTLAGLSKVYHQPLVGFEWLDFPDICRDSFYETWVATELVRPHG